jgi:hypothetical protein
MSDTNRLKPFFAPTSPKRIRLAAAQGLLPLSPAEILEILMKLILDEDGEIARIAEETLLSWPEEDLLVKAKSDHASPELLERLAGSASEAVLEAVILNPLTSSLVVSKLARTVPGRLLEIILYNKVRILRTPDILANARLNPSITGEASRSIKEIESEFFSAKSQTYSVDSGFEELTPEKDQKDEASFPAIAIEENQALPELISLEGLPADESTREGAIFEKLAKMSVPEKIKYALFGTREVRAILIRDTNKEIARTVLRSPKITDNEVEAFAAMRNVSEEILREIGNSREHTRSYTVIHNLVKNPKTPSTISQRMLNRVLTKDLSLLTRDRGIPEAVRRSAQRILSQRTSSKASG